MNRNFTFQQIWGLPWKLRPRMRLCVSRRPSMWVLDHRFHPGHLRLPVWNQQNHHCLCVLCSREKAPKDQRNWELERHWLRQAGMKKGRPTTKGSTSCPRTCSATGPPFSPSPPAWTPRSWSSKKAGTGYSSCPQEGPCQVKPTGGEQDQDQVIRVVLHSSPPLCSASAAAWHSSRGEKAPFWVRCQVVRGSAGCLWQGWPPEQDQAEAGKHLGRAWVLCWEGKKGQGCRWEGAKEDRR